MTGEDATAAAIDALIELDVPFILVGSFSSNQYGIPRSTKDADFVLQLGAVSILEIARKIAPDIRLDPQMTFETVTMTRRYEANVVDSTFTIGFFLLGDDPHDIERFRRRQRAAFLGRAIFVPTVEDVIITKLRWARSKDKDDVRDVLAVQGDERIDWEYVRRWTHEHGTDSLLKEIRRSIPPI
jgi:predicted nucleotidyltransferase